MRRCAKFSFILNICRAAGQCELAHRPVLSERNKLPRKGVVRCALLVRRIQQRGSRLASLNELEYKEMLRTEPLPTLEKPEISDRKTMSTSTITRGLEGVVAASSGVCYIDGDAGVLAYRGIDIHELAEKSTFEETCYLLWFGQLPKAAELADLKQKLGAERKIDPAIYDMMRRVPKTATPMEVLRTAVSALSFYDAEAEKVDHDANVRKSIRLTSQIAMIVAGYDRIRKGKNVVDPDPTISHSANFLLQLNGEKPSPTAEKALDVALILHADHELNASTFAARVTAATLLYMHSAITSAIGALKGPLHGGANEAVFTLLEKISSSGADPVEQVRGILAQKKKIPGFGHRVYHTEDPRATHLRKMSQELGKSQGESKWFDYSTK